jgi:uncharacterized protein with GYD domain
MNWEGDPVGIDVLQSRFAASTHRFAGVRVRVDRPDQERDDRLDNQQEEILMAKYLIHASYTAEGVKGVISEGGSSRRDTVSALAESLDGKVESFYFAFGDDDVVTILDFPDNVPVAAVSMTVGASGLVATKTTVLLTPEEVDQAAEKSVAYRPPGQ